MEAPRGLSSKWLQPVRKLQGQLHTGSYANYALELSDRMGWHLTDLSWPLIERLNINPVGFPRFPPRIGDPTSLQRNGLVISRGPGQHQVSGPFEIEHLVLATSARKLIAPESHIPGFFRYKAKKEKIQFFEDIACKMRVS